LPAIGFSVLAFGIAVAAIALRAKAVPDAIAYFTDRLRYVPAFGLLFLCVSFAALGLKRAGSMRGHELGAITLVALSTSLLHNLSSPEFRPFYDNNPIIPIAFAYLFSALDRAELPKLKWLAYVLALSALFSPKFDRVLAAEFPTKELGNWSYLRVNSS